MKATTIKAEGHLIQKLEWTKPRSQTLTSYVRRVLQQEVATRPMLAAEIYVAFLSDRREERARHAGWDGVARTPKRKTK